MNLLLCGTRCRAQRNSREPVDLDSELLKETAEELPLPEELYQASLRFSKKKEPSTFIRDGNVIAEGFNAELDELRALKNHGGQFLVDYEAREKERTGIPNLRVEFNSVSRLLH